MKIGQYKLGRYHAIIEKQMEDGTFMYETNFISHTDLYESVSAIKHCIFYETKCGMDNPLKIIDMNIYIGKDAINKLNSLV